jgi:alkylation response protein AidB-like acyl-CoA dehydrogenase
MGYLEYDLDLSEEHARARESAHRFASEVLRSAGIELDRMTPDEVVAPGSPLFGVLRQASELGYTRMGAPVEMGGMGLDAVGRYIVTEELSWGSAGLSGVVGLSSTHAMAALGSGRPDLIEELGLPFLNSSDGSIVGCWAITEPDHGSDNIAVLSPELRAPGPGQLLAKRDGDDWILRGQKAAWVSNAPIATHAMLNAHLEPGATLERGGVFLLPLDLPGISRGRPLDKVGVRSLPQGELFFDDVRVPGRYLIATPDEYAAHVEGTLTSFNAGVGCLATGLARAAYDCALDYAKQRVQGGRPIFEHQAVRTRLFRMFSLVQASRALSRQVFVYNSRRLEAGQPGALQHSIASKVFSTRVAHEVALLAFQAAARRGQHDDRGRRERAAGAARGVHALSGAPGGGSAWRPVSSSA